MLPLATLVSVSSPAPTGWVAYWWYFSRPSPTGLLRSTCTCAVSGGLPLAANHDPVAVSYRSNISRYSAEFTPSGSEGGGTSSVSVTDLPGFRSAPSGVAGPVVTTAGLSGLYQR